MPFSKLFLGPKTHILMPPKSCDHYALIIRTYITCFNFVIFRFTLFKSRKNFQEMDKKNVQKSICQNLFAQKRAALGDLRNFFGSNKHRPLWCDKCYIVNFSHYFMHNLPENGGCRPSFAHNASDPLPCLHLWVFLNERNSGALNACAICVAYIN